MADTLQETVGDTLGDAVVDTAGDSIAETTADTLPESVADQVAEEVEDTSEPIEWGELPAPGDWQKERQLSYLEWACQNCNPGDGPVQLMLHIECAKRLGLPEPAAGTFADDKLDGTFNKLFRLQDTSDFDALRLINLIYGHRGHPALSETLWTRIEEALLTFKYWYSDPTPQREWEGQPVFDNMWYWSENHVLIFRTVEYLMGQKYPDRVFEVTGMTGAQHRDRARQVILTWLEERAMWGFTEWHSDVYYNWDMNPLLTLIEWAEDPEVAFKAAIVSDLLYLDMALHIHKGNLGATHGRSYIKDKPAAELQDLYDPLKIVYNDTDRQYRSTGCTQCLLLARTNKYALPQVANVIAHWDQPMVDQERMNLPLDEKPPLNWDDPIPPHPQGLTYDDEELVAFWWSMSAFTTWPLLPLTIEVANKHNLWAGQFKDFKMVGDLVNAAPNKPPMQVIHPVYKQIWPVIGSGLLTEVHTYTYRDNHVMLSTAQDYRPGTMSNQTHAGQATLSEDAVVFVTHPGYLPVPEGEEVPENFNWQKSDEPGPGYWTGNASRPRSAQHGKAVIHIYAPQFPPKLLGQKVFDYRDETHAYFPVAHFDEVVLTDAAGWVFGREGDAYVGLWSHRPTTWRSGQPEVWKNGDQPFDLVAEGGASNVWVMQVASAAQFESFGAFQDALIGSIKSVKEVADKGGDGFGDGFSVVFQSPTEGEMEFDWHAPLKVGGVEFPLHQPLRFKNPFATAEFGTGRYQFQATSGDEESSLLIDFAKGVRTAVPQ